MARFRNPVPKFLYNNGTPLANGLLYFYESNTAIEKNTYADEGLTIANTNPVELYANGDTPNIFYAGDAKVILTDSAFVQLWERDPVTSGEWSIESDPIFLKDHNADGSHIVFKSVADLRANTVTPFDGQKVNLLGSNTPGDGGSGDFIWNPTSTETDENGRIIKVTAITTGRFYRQFKVVTPEIWGGIGDFDPSTGLGTDSRLAIIAAKNYLISIGGGDLVFNPDKHYYLGTGYEDGTYAWQIQIGSNTVPDAADSVRFTGGGTIYQGAAGKAIVIHNANNCSIDGVKIIGYTGGTLGASRENDALIVVGHNSKQTKIVNNYLTNSLGDCIFAGGAVDQAGGGLIYTPIDLTIEGNTLKERYGNGVASVSGGTRSREATALIDNIGVSFKNNIIYGSVDLEPNLTNQNIVDVDVNNNHFYDGHVTAQSVIVTDYWHDEPTNSTGGSILDCAIKLQGVAGAPIIENVHARNNFFETGIIFSSRVYEFDSIDSNVFKNGQIILSADNGIGSMSGTIVKNNVTKDRIAGKTGFITIDGQITQSSLINNSCLTAGIPVIAIGVAAIGPAFDQGNEFIDNFSQPVATSIIGTINKTSVVRKNDIAAGLTYTTGLSTALALTIVPSASINETINWPDYNGTYWYMTMAGGSARSLDSITNLPADGTDIVIQSGSSGAGTFYINHTATIKTRTGAPVLVPDNFMMTFRVFAGILFEK